MGDKLLTFAHTFHNQAATAETGTAMDVGGLAVVGIQVQGIDTATVNFKASIDGTNYVAIRAMNMNSGAVATKTTADGLWLVPVAGLASLQTDIEWTAGTITVTGKGSIAKAVALTS